MLLDRWSFHRDRTPFLKTAFSRWTTLEYAQLRSLDSRDTLILDDFYGALEQFRLYARTTEDMPEALEEAYDEALLVLQTRGMLAVEILR